MNIAIISGSARPERQSHQVALHIAGKLNDLQVRNWVFDVKELNLPMLDYLYSKHPAPSETLIQLKKQLDATDGFIVVSPEHNGSYPGTLKNSMDYFLEEYAHKPFAIVTVSSGMFGGINVLKNLQQYLVKLNGILMPEFILTPQVQKLFSDQKLQDDDYAKRVDQFLNDFILFSDLNQP